MKNKIKKIIPYTITIVIALIFITIGVVSLIKENQESMLLVLLSRPQIDEYR